MNMQKDSNEIRVIAPSLSWGSKKFLRNYERAQERLESLGYKVTFAINIKNVMHFGTASSQDRADDFNAAYSDKNVKIVVALTGGWSANEILPLIDWQTVKDNPKPLVGFSDITVLLNAIYAKTGNVGYLGPNFSTIGRMLQWQYTLEKFNAVINKPPIQLMQSKYCGEHGSKRRKTTPWKTLQTGTARATVIGGNLGSLYLLQGTPYMPSFNKPFIFLLEDDDEAGVYTAREVSRRLESLLQLPHFRENLRGLIVGRFPKSSRVLERDIVSIVASKKLTNIPIVYNIDFGHTLPMLTLPIGGSLELIAAKEVTISLL